ncbi:MAG: hypothetical protein AAFO74_13075 [Pseudomonadota bacterium]
MFNKHDLAGAGRWVRDHFSNWFASSFVMAAWFAVICVVIFVDFTMGGEYMERWSPKEELNFRFRLLGYAMAGAPIAIMAAGFMARRNGMLKAGALAIGFAVILSLFSIAQSIGTMSLTAENMTQQAEAFERVETTDTNRLDFLKSERQLVIDTRDAEIARIQSSIDAIENDGIPGIPRADQDSIDNYNARIDTLRNDANAEIERIGDEIKLELETPDTGSDPLVAPMKFDPMVVVINWFTSLGQPTDLSKRWITIIYLTLIAIVICLIGQTLSLFLSITARRSAEATLKDPVRVEAGKKAAETKNRRKRQTLKIQEQADSYLAGWRKAVQYAKNTKWTAKGIAQTSFPNLAIDHVIEVLRKANKNGDWRPELEEEINLVKRLVDPPEREDSKQYAVDIIEPNPTLNGGTPHDDDDTNRVAAD